MSGIDINALVAAAAASPDRRCVVPKQLDAAALDILCTHPAWNSLVSLEFLNICSFCQAKSYAGSGCFYCISSSAGLGESGMRQLAAHFRRGGALSLCVLVLSRNNLGDFGAALLARTLGDIPQLTVLNLVRNAIEPGGAFALALGLASVPLLQTLDLGSTCVHACAGWRDTV
jgi:Leucine Rich repeat